MDKVIITGINGFVGEHTARQFKERGFEVIGVGHDDRPNEKVASLLSEYIGCDLLNEVHVTERLALNDGIVAIIHLAGLSNVGESFNQPQRYLTENGIMTHNLLAKAAADDMRGRSVVVSTGALYNPDQPLPLSEEAKTNANSPYAVGKLMTEHVAHYHKSRGLDVIVARPFNHIGPGQGLGFILPDLYNSLEKAKESGKVTVGNLKTRRDYTDVRDIARAYFTLATADGLQHDTYNICSGTTLSGEEILRTVQEIMDLHDVSITVDPDRIRPNDIIEIYGDASRIHNETGWQPEINIKQTIADYVSSRRQS